MNQNNYLPDQAWLDTLADVPDFWKGSVEDVEAEIKQIKRGRVTLGCHSAGGRNVYMVEYGKPNNWVHYANYSSATCVDNKTLTYYADKTKPETVPCLMLVGGIHGAEFEGVVSLLNLIHIFETGRDYLGEERPELYDMAEHAHIVIIPCANPDGRARYPYKSVWGLPLESFRYYAQGTWKDGTLCNHPECKKYHPIKDYADFLGCYYNDNGVNLQQDVILPMADETRFLMETAHEMAPDIILEMHGGCDTGGGISDTTFSPQRMRNKVTKLEWKVNTAYAKAGYKYVINPKGTLNDRDFYSLGLDGVLHLCCGGMSLVYESNQGVFTCVHPDTEMLPYEDIYATHRILYKTVYDFMCDMCEQRKKTV